MIQLYHTEYKKANIYSKNMFDFCVDKRKYVRYNTNRTDVHEHMNGAEDMVMNKRKNIEEMTDREYRAYKRKVRRQKEQIRRIVTVMLTILFITVCVVSYHSLTTKADNTPNNFKYYTGIVVKSGDTLWTLADQYIDYTEYKNKAEYIEEVCSINRLEDESDIRAGQRIIFPYYSSEFVK